MVCKNMKQIGCQTRAPWEVAPLAGHLCHPQDFIYEYFIRSYSTCQPFFPRWSCFDPLQSCFFSLPVLLHFICMKPLLVCPKCLAQSLPPSYCHRMTGLPQNLDSLYFHPGFNASLHPVDRIPRVPRILGPKELSTLRVPPHLQIEDFIFLFKVHQERRTNPAAWTIPKGVVFFQSGGDVIETLWTLIPRRQGRFGTSMRNSWVWGWSVWHFSRTHCNPATYSFSRAHCSPTACHFSRALRLPMR